MKRKKLFIVTAVLILVGTLGYLFREQIALEAFDVFMSDSVERSLEKTYKPLKGDSNSEPFLRSDPFNIVLLGSDQRKNEHARSDSMILAVVRPKESKVLLISVPRDTYVNIIGKGKKDKITHAFAFGGHEMAKKTMEAFLDEKIKYYASINFNGLKNLVDAMGGVELPISKDIINKGKEHEKFTVKANKPIYSGQEALNFVRYREDSDFDRTKRQQVFLNASAKRLLQIGQSGRCMS